MPPEVRARLIEQLRDAQRIGIIGPTSVDTELEHALHYVPGIPSDARDVVDLGSGAGLPALAIAMACPEISMLLVERRQKRADFLIRAVRSLGLRERIRVDSSDIEQTLRRPGVAQSFDVVTARAFAPPSVTLAVAQRLLRPGGRTLVSLPPGGDTTDVESACRRLDLVFSVDPGSPVARVTTSP